MHSKGKQNKLKSTFEYIKNRIGRTALICVAASLCFITVALTATLISIRNSALVVYINGDAVCRVDNEDTVKEALLILQKINGEKGVVGDNGYKVTYRHKLSFEPVVNAEKCAEKIYEVCEKNYLRSYVISFEGIVVGTCPTYAEAQKVVDEFYDYIIESVLQNDDSIDFVELTTEFRISSALCPSENIMSAEDICRLVLNNQADKDTASDVVSGDRVTANGSLSFVGADKNFIFGMIKNEADAVLPDFSFSFNFGELNHSIEFTTFVVEKYSEIIPYDTIYVETDELYIGESMVYTEGENGIAENIYEVAYEDGEEIARRLVSSTVISKPQSRVKYVGTKAYPSTDPTGFFMWPIQQKFIITSYFGSNRAGIDEPGKAHNALDIAGMSIGTTVHAADGGTVIFAQESGTYGLLVKIAHENGVETWYAHNRTITVNVGDKVYKGQKIAEVGMTGNTTGPHCHFEVRINGKSVNPINYLPKEKPGQ